MLSDQAVGRITILGMRSAVFSSNAAAYMSSEALNHSFRGQLEFAIVVQCGI